MFASIGAVASPSQGGSYYERDGYYAKDDPEHRAASAWAGRGGPSSALKARTVRPSPGSHRRSADARAEAKCTARKRWSLGQANASAGRATMRVSDW